MCFVASTTYVKIHTKLQGYKVIRSNFTSPVYPYVTQKSQDEQYEIGKIYTATRKGHPAVEIQDIKQWKKLWKGICKPIINEGFHGFESIEKAEAWRAECPLLITVSANFYDAITNDVGEIVARQMKITSKEIA
jgi:hypothetical protein